MNEKLADSGMIAGMVISWSVYYAVSKLVVDISGSVYLTGFMLRLVALFFLSAQLLANKGFARLFHQGKSVFILLLIGVFGFLLDLFANLGYAGGSLSTGTALLKTDVLMVNIASVFIYRKKLYLTDWLGSLVMLSGVLMVLGVDLRNLNFNLSDLFFIASALCVSANAFIIKAAQEKYHEDSEMISNYNNLVVLSLFALSCLLRGDFAVADAVLLKETWWLILLGGLGQTGIYYFYYRNLRRHEVWLVKLYLLLMPVLSCFIGVFFLGELLNSEKLLGILIVLSGAVIILLRAKLHHIRQS